MLFSALGDRTCSWLAVAAGWLVACGVDSRMVEPTDPISSLGGQGGRSDVVDAPGGASGAAGNAGGSGGGGQEGVGGIGGVQNTPIALGDNGDACSSSEACESNQCELTGAAGSSRVCCSADCTDSQRCSADGASCLEPLLAGGIACERGEQCGSSYCQSFTGLCAPNPCTSAIPGKYCDRGSQCDAAGLCIFTGMGMVAAGPAHTCAIVGSGGVRCWGDNTDGQLGARLDQTAIGDTADEVPADVADLLVSFGTRRAVQVTAGNFHSCVILDDGNVRCWGSNQEGQQNPTLANGDIGLPPGELAIQIDAGGAHTCAVLASGGLACWGFNTSGQLGGGDALPLGTSGAIAPRAIDGGAMQVSCGSTFSCAVLGDGGLTCWGNGQFGVLGYGEASDRFEPLGPVDVGGGVQYVGAGTRSTCAVLTTGAVRCWGDNDAGILGYGHATGIGLTETPARAATLTAPDGGPLGGDVQLGGNGAVQVEVNSDSGHTCVRFSGGAVRCFGDNNDGSLGYGHEQDIGDDETPAQAAQLAPVVLGGDVPFGRTVLALAAGGRCAVLNDRSVICWGRNSTGQLGMPALYPEGTPDLTPQELIAAGTGPVRFE